MIDNRSSLPFALSLFLLAAACATPGPPKSAQNEYEPSRSSSARQVSTIDEPVELVSLKSTIRRGTIVDSGGYVPLTCAPIKSDLVWEGSPGDEFSAAHKEDIGDAFQAAGLTLVAYEPSAFRTNQQSGKTDFLLAGTIVDYALKSCFWDWTATFGGSARIEVKWELYSQFSDEVVFFRTKTSNINLKEKKYGRLEFLDFAIEQAAYDLALDPDFRNALQSAAQQSSARSDVASQDQWDRLVLSAPPLRQASFTSSPDPVLDATVVLYKGQSHGSGFIVSRDGYILTNAHVVGRSGSISVRLRDGREYTGEVLRRHDDRDVALVKIPAAGLSAVPIRRAPAKTGEAVYAIGAPYDASLGSTVSSGIVSALRPAEPGGLDYVQSDALIHGGNSGGPLVDRNGNVVAMAVSGIVQRGTQLGSGLGFFIPIADGLERLNLSTR